MGTRYIVKRHNGTELYLDEHSNRFDIGVDTPDPENESGFAEIRDLSFADLREIRDKIDEILDYWDERDEPGRRSH